MTFKEALDYGLGAVAVIALTWTVVKLLEFLGNRKAAQNSSSASTTSPEIVAALNRNSDAISRLTQLLEMQFGFEKERRAEDRTRIERLQETLDSVLKVVIENQHTIVLNTEAIKSEIIQNIGKLRSDLKFQEGK